MKQPTLLTHVLWDDCLNRQCLLEIYSRWCHSWHSLKYTGTLRTLWVQEVMWWVWGAAVEDSTTTHTDCICHPMSLLWLTFDVRSFGHHPSPFLHSSSQNYVTVTRPSPAHPPCSTFSDGTVQCFTFSFLSLLCGSDKRQHSRWRWAHTTRYWWTLRSNSRLLFCSSYTKPSRYTTMAILYLM